MLHLHLAANSLVKWKPKLTKRQFAEHGTKFIMKNLSAAIFRGKGKNHAHFQHRKGLK